MAKKRDLTSEDFTKLREFGALTEEEVAYYYNFSRTKLAHWRMNKTGPRYSKPEGRVLYRVKDIEAFLDQHTVQTTGV